MLKTLFKKIISPTLISTICLFAILPPASADAVIAVIEGQKIYESDFQKAYNQLPPKTRAQDIKKLYPHVLERIIQQKLITKLGRDKGLKDDPEVIKRLRVLEDQLIFEAYLAQIADQQIIDEDIRREYEIYAAKIPTQEEVRVSHILVDSESEARNIIKLVGEGKVFADLAQQYSKGPSREFGGDLGYFIKGRMVPEFEHVAFALAPNSYSIDPVQTQYGWHVILVKDKRMTPKPSYAEMEPVIRNKMREALAMDIAIDLVNNAQVERFDMAGRPMPAPINPTIDLQ